MPSTRDITDQVLSGKNFRRTSRETYGFVDPLYPLSDEYIPRVVKFMERLRTEIDLYYSYQTGRYTNYEDLCYVTTQIFGRDADDKLPTITPLVNGSGDFPYLLYKWYLSIRPTTCRS